MSLTLAVHVTMSLTRTHYLYVHTLYLTASPNVYLLLYSNAIIKNAIATANVDLDTPS
jgi:hypothetical protein